MKECLSCGFNDEDYGCACPSSDKLYACPIESEKAGEYQGYGGVCRMGRKER